MVQHSKKLILGDFDVHLLPVPGQCTLSMSAGFTGTRKWLLGQKVDLRKFLTKVCEHHWPDDPDSIVSSITYGAFNDKVETIGGTFDSLERYSATLVVAQYQMMDIDTAWPDHIPRPKHPSGTTLSLRVTNSGKYITNPAGNYKYYKDLPGLTGDTDIAVLPAGDIVQVIPINEYHLVCDRLLPSQVPDWRKFDGTVNNKPFLGEQPETMMFDGAQIDESFAVHVNPKKRRRYKATAVFRCQSIPMPDKEAPGGMRYIGWNHEFRQVKDQGGMWLKIYVRRKKPSELRYPPINYNNFFFK